MWEHFRLSFRKPVIQNVTNIAVWTFLVFGVYLFFFAQEPGWAYPRFQGVVSWLSALLITLPFIVYRTTFLRQWYKEHLVVFSEACIAIPLAINGFGALYFFERPWGYDSFLHFTSSFLGVFLIYLVIGALWRHDKEFHRILLFFIAVAGAFLSGALMELLEFASDHWLGTTTWGETGQPIWQDTMDDLWYDALGIGFAALALFFFGKTLLARMERVRPRVEELRDRAREWTDEKRDRVRERVGKVYTQTTRAVSHARERIQQKREEVS